MLIDPAKIDSAAVPQSAPADTAAGVGAGTGAAEPATGDQVLLSGSPGQTFQQLQQQKEQQNGLAGAIRKTDQAARALGQKIDQVKAPLQAILKNFPPFSPEDQARMKLLRSYFSLRKQMDELQVPPPPDVLQARKAESVPAPLAISANDSQIADHVAKLDAAAASLDQLRHSMAAQTSSIWQPAPLSGAVSAVSGGENGAATPVLGESAALQKSAEVGRQFANSLSQGVTFDNSQFLKGLS